MSWTIEEAAERVFIHAGEAAKEFGKLLIKMVDSDVIVMAISVFHGIADIKELNLVWI